MRQAKTNKRSILLILLLAFALRIWGVWNADTSLELIETMEALRICAGHPNMNRFVKRVYCYGLALEYGGYYGVRRLLNACESPMDFAAQVVREPRPLLLISRFTNVILSTLCIWLCYRLAILGRLGKSAVLGTLGAVFCPVIVHFAKVGSVDTTLVVMVLLVMFFTLRIVYRRPSTWNYLLVGVFLGLACQTKPQGIMVAPCLIAAHIWVRVRDGGGWRSVVAVRPLLVAFGGFVLGFLLGNPVVVVAPGAWLSHMWTSAQWYCGKVGPKPLHGPLLFPVFYFKAALSELGVPLCALAVFGCLVGVKRREPSILIIALGALSFMLVMGSAREQCLLSQHQALYCLTLLSILAGVGMYNAFEWVRGRWQTVWRAGVVICALAFPVYRTARLLLSYTGYSTRKQTELWVKGNIPPGSKVLMDSGRHVNYYAPDIPESRENILETMERLQRELEQRGENVDPIGRKWDSYALTYYRLRMKTVPRETYDITSTMGGKELKPLEYYQQNGFQYIITCSRIREFIQEQVADQFPVSAKFYDSLDAPDSPARRLATFGPGVLHRGPVFSVYALRPPRTGETE
ncbi:MAG: hypothetical protein GXP25_16550 [Planctomycetes bacterium]|nr:hypothetical protein [Planctomycetota bacterium]